MTLSVQSLSDLTQDDYDAALALVREMIQADHPDVELVGGVLDTLLVHPSALLEAVNQKNIDRVRAASSLLAIEADPTLADDADETVVDRLSSNYRISRIEAAESTGTALIFIDELTLTIVPEDTVFEDAAGNTYSVTSGFIGQIDEDDVIADTDRLITAVGDGTFSFSVDVAADATGPGGNIARGSVLTTETTIANFVKAVAGEDFTGGRDEEMNTELIARLRSSWTSRTPATRAGLEGLLRSQEGFEDMIAVSTIGYGDAELQRASSILPVALPGRVDCYVRTDGPAESKVLTKTALLVSKYMGNTRGVWQITLGRDDGPYYLLEKVSLPADAYDDLVPGFSVVSTTRGYDVSSGDTPGLTFLPDVTSASEAAFSRYQQLTFTFQDSITDASSLTSGVSTSEYAVAVKSMRGIVDLQDAVAARATRSLVGDVLIKAAVPVFVEAVIEVDHITSAEEIDEDAVQAAVAEVVNDSGFGGKLQGSALINAAQAALPSGSTVTAIDMDGTVYKPDGTTTALSSTSVLDVGSSPSAMVTSRTCCFFTAASDIELDITEVAPVES